MTAGTLNAFQLPASLRAVDSVADAFHESASRVGCRVYGHAGGLTVRERYILAEKRELHLKRSREEFIEQRDKQRKLRGELVRVEKHARRMVRHASQPCGRDGGKGATHSVVASIKSAGAQRSVDLSSSGDVEARQQITAHVDEVRAVIGRMGHTMYMARVRSELRAAIIAQGQKRAAATLDCEQETGDGQTIAGGPKVDAREASGLETPEVENGKGGKVGLANSSRERAKGGRGYRRVGAEQYPSPPVGNEVEILEQGSHAIYNRGTESVPQVAVGLRCCRDEDPEVKSPRERYLRRMAAVCLQRHARGRPQRRVFRELVRPALHICIARAQPRISPSGIADRRAILLTRFVGILDVYDGLRDLVPTISNLTCRSRKHRQRNPVTASAPRFGSDAAMGSTDGVVALPSSSHPAAETEVFDQSAIASNSTEAPVQGPDSRKGEEGASAITPNSGESTMYRTATGETKGARGNSNSSEAAQTAEREAAIVLWALRDAAARVVQEEMRCFVRRKRWLLLGAGQRQREPGDHREEGRLKSTVGVESPTGTGVVEIDRDNENGVGYQPEVGGGGLPWAIAAGVSSIGPTTTSSSSARAATARTTTTGGTTTAGTSSSTGGSTWRTMTADTRTTNGKKNSRSVDDSWAPASPTTNRSPHTACSTVSSARSSPATPRTTTAAGTSASGGYTGRTTTAGTTGSSSATRRTKDSSTCGESPKTSSFLVSPTTSRSPHTAGWSVSTPWSFQQPARTRTQGDREQDYPALELAWTWEEEWGEDEPPDEKQTGNGARRETSRAVPWPILPSEERKKRENEAHLRRNKSRLGLTLRGLANLECQGNFVLPEIIRMQRLFRARRTRRIYERSQAHREAHQAEWKAKTARERQERAARWKSSMSRLKIEHPPNPMRQLGDVAGFVARVVSGSSNEDNDGVAPRAVFAELKGKDAPYASASWSLAVAYNVGSWRGGLRQRYYFGRLVRFLAHRRSRKAALRDRVTARMAKRLQAWATALAKEKRSLVCEVKARAPAEIVGAHLRFLSRTGTWDRLLLNLNQILETAVSQRERAMDLLSEQVVPETRGASRQGRTAHSARTPTASPHRFPRARVRSSHSNHDKTPSRHTSSRQGGSPDTWAAGSFRVFRGEVSAERSGTKAGGSPIHPATRENMAGSRRARLTAESRRRVRVTEIVDERTLRCLHPWIVTLLARSAVQFVPSVPHKHRVGFRMDDTNKVEALAETQLTRRYWRLLGGVSDAVSLVVAAKLEAATLAAEAGEWLLLLGFAHHLVSKGHIGLPCTLPALPRNSSINGPASSITVLGMISKQANLFLAPVRRKRAGKAPRLKEDAPAAQHQQQGPVATDRHGQHHQPTTTLYASGPADQGEQGQATSVPKWFSAHKTLCATCWALRTGASAAGGSKCQRCGRTHARGFSHEVSKRGGDDAADPVPWQQFSQVKESLDLFIVHAAYACVLHPGPLNNATVAAGLGGGLGWWNGGDTEQAWWRAVCGGKEAAKRLRDGGCDTMGKLYTYVRGSAVQCSSSSSSLAGCGDYASPKKARARTKKLRRLVNDGDLATKIASLLLRLMSAFEELRKQYRWPSVSKAAVDRTMRRLELPRMAGTAPTPGPAEAFSRNGIRTLREGLIC